MFTGIVQEVGKFTQLKSHGSGVTFTVEAPRSVKELRINDSILINGVCLTVIDESDPTLKVEAVEETLRKTTLGELKPHFPYWIDPSGRWKSSVQSIPS